MFRQLAQPQGFSFVVHGEVVEIASRGRPVASLRGLEASRFLARAANLDELGLQHLMARATGNYKRGNERAPTDD